MALRQWAYRNLRATSQYQKSTRCDSSWYGSANGRSSGSRLFSPLSVQENTQPMVLHEYYVTCGFVLQKTSIIIVRIFAKISEAAGFVKADLLLIV